MLSINDIINVSFRKAGMSGGYRSEDVDSFIDQVHESYDMLMKKTIQLNDQLNNRNNESEILKNQITELKNKIDSFQNDESAITKALLSAQKIADQCVRDSKKEANDIITNAKEQARKIVDDAQYQADSQKDTINELKKQVSDFRSNILDQYKKHLSLINALPHSEKPVVSTSNCENTTKIVETKEAPAPKAVSFTPVEDKPKHMGDSKKSTYDNEDTDAEDIFGLK